MTVAVAMGASLAAWAAPRPEGAGHSTSSEGRAWAKQSRLGGVVLGQFLAAKVVPLLTAISN